MVQNDQLKTYKTVNQANESENFSIARMEEIYERRKGAIDEPHRHNFFTVLLVKEAKGKHIIDFKEHELASNQVYFIHPGQVHQVKEETRSTGYVITFSSEFLIRNNISVSFIENLNLFNSFGDAPPLVVNSQEIEKLCAYAMEVEEVFAQEMEFKFQAIGALLKLILIRCNSICTTSQPNTQLTESGSTLFRNFKELINKNYSNWHQISEYAEELHITADHLNRVSKSLTGLTAKEHIQNRIIIAAKRLLYFTDLNNKEVGFELGFSEPSHFSAFFKKCTGKSPSQFKKAA